MYSVIRYLKKINDVNLIVNNYPYADIFDVWIVIQYKYFLSEF